jgi:hypothetical protein
MEVMYCLLNLGVLSLKKLSPIEFLRSDELASVIEKISKKIKGDAIALTII